MGDIVAIQPTGSRPVDAALRRIIAAFEVQFPGRVRGYYVEGSYADATGVPTSDLDLLILFADGFVPDEAAQARAVLTEQALVCALELDGTVLAEADMVVGVDPAFKYAARLVYGTDSRADLPLLPLAAWTRDRMHSSYGRLVWLTGRPPLVRPPLDYPDPADEFYGYVRRPLRLADGRLVPGTRDLIRLVGWAATARLAWETGTYVARKGDCARLYRAQIGDEWADLLDALYDQCRGRWAYRVPNTAAERTQLRAVCARTLAFENHFLAVYRRFVAAELAGAGPAQAAALRILTAIPCDDPAIQAAVAAAIGRDAGV